MKVGWASQSCKLTWVIKTERIRWYISKHLRRKRQMLSKLRLADSCPHPDRKHHCKGKCRSCYDKQHRLDNHATVRTRERRSRDKHRERNRANRRLWWRRKNGICHAGSEIRFGPCEICERHKPLCYDHDHATGQHRGWLCHGCNLRLGWFEKHGRRMTDYLAKAAGRVRGGCGEIGGHL